MQSQPFDPIVINDLVADAALVLTAALNSFPASMRSTIATAHAGGGLLEVRVRPQPEGGAAHVAVWLLGPGDRQIELFHLGDNAGSPGPSAG